MTLVTLFLTLTLALSAFAQSEGTTFRSEVRNTFIWGEDAPDGAESSSIKDPLTGSEILTLKHAGVEVTSRMGFQKLDAQVGELLAYTSTIVNETSAALAVQNGGVAIDGRIVPQLTVVTSHDHLKRQLQKRIDAIETSRLSCFSRGFLASDNFFPHLEGMLPLIVQPHTSLTVSSVIRDLRHYSLLCSVDGCFPKGTIRYSIRVGSHEYIFKWPGSSLANCGN